MRRNSKNLVKRCFALCSVIFMMSMSAGVSTVYADDLEDDLGGSTSSYSTDDGVDLFGDIKDQQVDSDDKEVINWLSDYNTMSAEHLSTASNELSPVLNLLGYATGAIIVFTLAGVTFITALDLLYIAVPPLRGLLYSSGSSGVNKNSFGMGMMGGMAQSQVKNRQLVSDEAVACAGMTGGSNQPMGMGMTGMNSMGSMQNTQGSTGSVIGTYFKKRIGFILLLAACIVILTSSAILDCGVNIAEFALKLVLTFIDSM